MAAQTRGGKSQAAVARAARKGAPGPPPRCPPGWATGPPDFVGVGAQRAGTSRWYQLISAHPQVERGEKELHYFDGFRLSDSFDVRAYREFFPRPPGKIIGEWSPSYMAMHWAPRLLAMAAPRAKLMVSLRDPVDRYLSALRFGAGRKDETPGDLAFPANYRSLYAAQLEHLRRYFARSRLLVLQFERCVLDPKSELRRTYEFLGIDPDWTPSETSTTATANKGRASVDLPDEERRALVLFLEGDVRRLVAEYPEIDVSLWPNFNHLA